GGGAGPTGDRAGRRPPGAEGDRRRRGRPRGRGSRRGALGRAGRAATGGGGEGRHPARAGGAALRGPGHGDRPRGGPMTMRTISRLAFGGALALARLPIDTTLRLAGDRGSAPVAKIAV